MNKPFKSENDEINRLIDWIIKNFRATAGDLKVDGFLTIGKWQFREDGDNLQLYHYEKGSWWLKDEWVKL